MADGASKEGAPIAGFFDEFNKDRDKQATTEEVNRKLCEVLTELAEDIVLAMEEATAAAASAEQAESSRREPPAAAAAVSTSASDEPAATPEAAGTADAQGPQDVNAAAVPEGAEGEATGDEGSFGASAGGVDEVAAMAAYNDALAAIMREKDFTSKDMCSLPDEHPLKELFFSAFDQHMFHNLLERFIGQVRSRKGGPGDWDAEAAEGECDEDHTLE